MVEDAAIQTEEVAEQKKLTWKEKRAARKEKRREKLRKKLLNPQDIKYQGPLSYRYLRILAWICLVLTQLVFLNSIGAKIGYQPINEVGSNILDSIGSLSTVFFIIASFGLVLSGAKTFKNFLIFYGAAFIGLGSVLCIFFARYVAGLFSALELTETETYQVIQEFASGKAQINVFTDLFAFVCFHFFLNYDPKKYFQGKKIRIFRAFVAFPIIYVAISLALKAIFLLLGADAHFPFYIFPFLTTKSPLMFLLFVCISLWIKYRERLFIRLGSTKKEYQAFLKTKRNSLSFSIQLCIFSAIFFVIDVVLLFGLLIYYVGSGQADFAVAYNLVTKMGIGQCAPLIFAIPFILLYSYTRTHKPGYIDLLLPVFGIAMIALTYVEWIYQFLTHIGG